MTMTLQALENFCEKHNFRVVASYPNTDPGAYDILNAIEEYESKPFIQFYKTIPRKPFINTLKHTQALVGNSSMGLLEAPFYRIPVVNIGNRQKGRLNAGNVEFVDYDVDVIQQSIEKACFDESYREHVKQLKNPFGDGDSAEQILKILNSIDINDRRWYVKQMI